MSVALDSGSSFAGYLIESVVGRGGMGMVWRARDQVLHREVALKEVRPPDPAMTGPEAAATLRERVLREARALARLSHPHVVTIHQIVDAGAGTHPWIVMELVPGESLADIEEELERLLDACRAADAVLLGAVGGPKWDTTDPDAPRPERGLLGLRKGLGLYANLRPVRPSEALAEASPLRPERITGTDLLVVRELTGGIYFGDRGRSDGEAHDTCVYTVAEIERIAHVAFDLARKRSGRVASAEKHNVMKSGVLWKEVVTRVHAEYSDVSLEHVLADNCAMQLVRRPKQYDVLVTDNLFGDVLSDVASMLTGSLGMLPSASLGAVDAKGSRKALYEPVHGSAPDIAGQGKANPIACILSFAMALRYSFEAGEAADRLEAAVEQVLADGVRTGDLIGPSGGTPVSTTQMGDAIVAALDKAA